MMIITTDTTSKPTTTTRETTKATIKVRATMRTKKLTKRVAAIKKKIGGQRINKTITMTKIDESVF